jgi:hypothetical protein
MAHQCNAYLAGRVTDKRKPRSRAQKKLNRTPSLLDTERRRKGSQEEGYERDVRSREKILRSPVANQCSLFLLCSPAYIWADCL